MRWLFDDGGDVDRQYAETVLRHVKTANAIVPSIWPLEVANVISRGEARGELLSEDSDEFIRQLPLLRIEVDHASSALALTDILILARHHAITSYDASYLELALRRNIPLSTLDQKLRKAAKKSGVKIFCRS